MSGVAYHAWTHRPKALGGTDPIETADNAIKSFIGVGTSETLTPGNSNFVWQTNTNRNPECFTPIIFGGSDYYQIRMLEDGLFTASVRATLSSALAYGIADVAVSMYRLELALHHSKRWTYDASNGFNDACFQWTFEMDGSAGSNRKIEFQIINFHASIGGTDDNLTANPIRVEVHKWPGTIDL